MGAACIIIRFLGEIAVGYNPGFKDIKKLGFRMIGLNV